MLELSLHILDVLENSMSAGATSVFVVVRQETAANRMEIIVQDNGPGLPVSPSQALDPFYTTKRGKRTGLGLSLFRTAAEQAGGNLDVTSVPNIGVTVHATMQVRNIDRSPLGDLGATLMVFAATHPGLELGCRFVVDERETSIRLADVSQELSETARDEFAVAQRFCERVRDALTSVGIQP